MKCVQCGGVKFVRKGTYLKPGEKNRLPGKYRIMKCCDCGKTAIGEMIK